MITTIPKFLGDLLSGNGDPFLTHALLLGGDVVATIIVGAGIIFESPRYSAKTHRAANAMVIFGISLETIFSVCLFCYDEGISNNQQSKIIALEKRIAPRSLSTEEIAALKAAVTPFADRQISIWSYGIDVEAGALAVQIKSALDAAHVQTVDSIGHMLSSVTPRIGVMVTGPDDKLVEALLIALKPLSAVRGPLPGGFTTLGEQPPTSIVPAEIFIGVKPISP